MTLNTNHELLRAMLRSILSFIKGEGFKGFLTFNPAFTSLAIFLLTGGILFLARPFGLDKYLTEHALILSGGIALIAVIGYCLSYIIYQPFRRKKWSNAREFVIYTSSLLFIWPLVYLYVVYCVEYLFPIKMEVAPPYQLADYFFLKCLYYTLAAGYTVYLSLQLADFLLSRCWPHSYGVSRIRNGYTTGVENLKDRINLFGKNKKEELHLNKQALVCIKSDGHYADIFYLDTEENQLVSQMFRSSLKSLQDQTLEHDFLYRCHNSYIINTKFLVRVEGNLNQAFAYIEHYPDEIPISKNKIRYMQRLADQKTIGNRDTEPLGE